MPGTLLRVDGELREPLVNAATPRRRQHSISGLGEQWMVEPDRVAILMKDGGRESRVERSRVDRRLDRRQGWAAHRRDGAQSFDGDRWKLAKAICRTA